MTYDCIIIGGGISGLSAAYGLHRRGANVLVLEANTTVGGALSSERTTEGFLLEHGPNTVVSNDPALWEHFAQLGIADARITAHPAASKRYVLKHGHPLPLPMGPGALARTPLLSSASKLRMLAEPLRPRTNDSDESVQAFFTRRIGSEPLLQLVDPFVSGVYAGDPAELSMRAAFPRLWDAEQRSGSLVRGMLFGPRTNKKPRSRREMFTFRDGLSTWTKAILAHLGPERVWLASAATNLAPVADGWRVTIQRSGRVEQVAAAHVIVATPAANAADLVAALDGAAATALRSIPYPSVAIVHLGYKRTRVAHPLDGFGMLCPSREQRGVLGILWPSSLFPNRAPTGAVLTTSFIGGARASAQARQSPEQLIETAVAEHEALLGARGAPILARTRVWERAIPQYTIGHLDRINAIERLEAAHPGLHLLANYRGGISVPQCWQNGQTLAERIASSVEAQGARQF